MYRKSGWIFVLLFGFAFLDATPAAADDRVSVEFEFSPIWQSRNDARIPNATGTKFSLRDIQGSGPFFGGRVFLTFALNPKNEIGFLAAPFSIAETGELKEPVFFAGKAFAAGPGVKARYEFNSYRLTYRYRIYAGDRWTWKLGITGKIRDAKAELSNATGSAVDDDLGLVPLLHLDGVYRLTDRWKFHLNMDGLAAPQGRAFDIAFKAKYDLSKDWTAAVGYRMLEGGADVDRVYTFAWLHYATASIAFRF
ncbi:MAG: hypothetical protein JXA73_01140 [Acidobacteria bacterium]|nr:hypothetical protein [Acidobacteriota bacterium]